MMRRIYNHRIRYVHRNGTELQLSVAQPISPSVAWRSAEKRLIQEAREGGRSAFDELVSPYLGDVRAFICARVDASEVDDVLQDTLVAAWKAIPLFDGRSRFRTWLFSICLHKIKDFYRARSRKRPEVSLDAGFIDPLIEGAQTRFETSDAVMSAMKRLPETQFEVIEMYYREKLTLSEIANVLERNLNTVKYQFCQGHLRLARAFAEEGLIP